MSGFLKNTNTGFRFIKLKNDAAFNRDISIGIKRH